MRYISSAALILVLLISVLATPVVDRSDDTSLSPSGVSPGAVNAVAVSGSDVYVGGTFSTAGEISASYIAKWDGNAWSSLGSGMNGFVHALAVAGNGDLYAGGTFISAGGVSANRIAKWNGSSWSPVGSGTNGPVSDLEISGNDIYAGGDFSTAGGVSANRIAKWDGSSWSPLGSGMNDRVNALALSGTDVYAGGRFTTAGGALANKIAKWDGSSWSALSSGVSSGTNSQVSAIAVSGSNVYAGGFFTIAGDSSAFNIAMWNGSSWSPLGSGIGGPVSALAISGSGNLYAGGDFTTDSSGGLWLNNIAEWNGSSWAALGSGITSPGNEWVLALTISGNGSVYAGGFFTTAGGYAASNVARWNGSEWSALVHFDIPSQQAADIIFAGVLPYQMDVSWTNGNGTGRVIKVNTVNSFTAPADGTNPGWDSRYSGSGEQVVYNGSDSTLTITGLSPNTSYYFRAYEYNGYGSVTSFNTDTATNNPSSQTTMQCNSASTALNTNDSGAGSLRQAIAVVCSGAPIGFDPSVFATPQTITLTSGELVIDKNVTIQGPGASLLSISGNFASRVFLVHSGVTASLDGMTIRDGYLSTGDSRGGGIANQGILTVTNTTVSNNTADDFCAYGGGIYNNGTLTVSHSTLSGNQALSFEECGGGGGIASNGTTSIHNSAVTDNYGGNYNGGGGGILNAPPNGLTDGPMTITNTTISGNTNLFNEGGGISNFGTLTVTGSTISNNSGGGILNYDTLAVSNSTVSGNTSAIENDPGVGITNSNDAGDTLTVNNSTITRNDIGIIGHGGIGEILRNTIVAGNTADDVVLQSATFETASHNLIGDAASAGGIVNGVNGNIVGVNPLLGPLRNNGGPTMTHALRPASPAINAGNSCVLTQNGCGDGNPALPADQRGKPRNGNVDIGAFERQNIEPSGTTPFDFDGDGKADPSVFRAGEGTWYSLRSTEGFLGLRWGLADDKLAAADYDGDGKTDPAIFRDGVWWIFKSTGGYEAISWGQSGDTPVPGDYDGDGKADAAIFRDGVWWILQTSGGYYALQWGLPTDQLVPADYDGDGKTDPAIFRDGVFWIFKSTGGYEAIQWGLPTDRPVPADYDGDGKADPAIFRDGIWWILQSTGGYYALPWGLPTDQLVPADYDGDGKSDPAIFRDGVWWIFRSTGGYDAVSWGYGTDVPVQRIGQP